MTSGTRRPTRQRKPVDRFDKTGVKVYLYASPTISSSSSSDVPTACDSNVLQLRLFSNTATKTWLRYDTVYLRALKSWRNGQLSLVHGTETEIKKKLKTKPSSSEEMVRVKSPWLWRCSSISLKHSCNMCHLWATFQTAWLLNMF